MFLRGPNVRAAIVRSGSFLDEDVDHIAVRGIRKEMNDLGHPHIHGMQDAFSGYSERYNKLLRQPGEHWFSHEWKGYYDSPVYKNLGGEAFANMFSASFSPDQRQAWATYFPTAWAEFEGMLGGIQ